MIEPHEEVLHNPPLLPVFACCKSLNTHGFKSTGAIACGVCDNRAPIARKLLILNRRDGRVVEGARLESVCRGNSTVGSNPTLSAIFTRRRSLDVGSSGLPSDRASRSLDASKDEVNEAVSPCLILEW